MSLNEFDEEQFEPDFSSGGEPSQVPPEKKPSNRNFLLAIGILGVILILALVLLALVAPGILNQQRASQNEQAAQIYANNTATAMAATAIAIQGAATATPIVVIPTKTPVILLSTSTPAAAIEATSALSAADQATVQALQTQMASQGSSSTQTAAAAATELPTSGFADEVGLPGMIGLAAVLIAVIFLSRKLRTSGH